MTLPIDRKLHTSGQQMIILPYLSHFQRGDKINGAVQQRRPGIIVGITMEIDEVFNVRTPEIKLIMAIVMKVKATSIVRT